MQVFSVVAAVVLCIVTLLFVRGMLSRRRKLLVYYANVQAEETSETAEDTKATLMSVRSASKYIVAFAAIVIVIVLTTIIAEIFVLVMKAQTNVVFSDWYDDKGTFFDLKQMERKLSERYVILIFVYCLCCCIVCVVS